MHAPPIPHTRAPTPHPYATHATPQGDFLRKVENGISFGMPVLLQDILEELDPSLEPVLSKSIIKMGTREVMRLGDKELDYSRDFRFYMTTKLGNPHYTPEVSTKANIVNFAVKQEGLEAQLLGAVVDKEQPELGRMASELTIRMATGKNKLVALEDTILRLLRSVVQMHTLNRDFKLNRKVDYLNVSSGQWCRCREYALH